jgi:hypothetical protein
LWLKEIASRIQKIFPKFAPRKSLNMSHTAFGEIFPEIARLVKGFIKNKNIRLHDLPVLYRIAGK